MSETVADVRETRQERDAAGGSRRLSPTPPRPTSSELWALGMLCGNHIRSPSGTQDMAESLALLALRDWGGGVL